MSVYEFYLALKPFQVIVTHVNILWDKIVFYIIQPKTLKLIMDVLNNYEDIAMIIKICCGSTEPCDS
jgi:hypothetical protein